MKWSKSNNALRWCRSSLNERGQQVARVACWCFVVMLCLPGCTATWESRKPDLRTLWGDINTYNRLSFGYERRHHAAPSNQVIHEYRWLHGPVPLIPASSVAGIGHEMSWQETEAYPPVYSTEMPHSVMKSAPDRISEIDTLNPPVPAIKPAPASKAIEEMKVKRPVEIVLPPLEALRNYSGGSTQDEEEQSQYPTLNGPTASYRYSQKNANRVQPARYQSRKASLPGSTILFARP